jgi:hypothetical protein
MKTNVKGEWTGVLLISLSLLRTIHSTRGHFHPSKHTRFYAPSPSQIDLSLVGHAVLEAACCRPASVVTHVMLAVDNSTTIRRGDASELPSELT